MYTVGASIAVIYNWWGFFFKFYEGFFVLKHDMHKSKHVVSIAQDIVTCS